jgi:hypothetical protein
LFPGVTKRAKSSRKSWFNGRFWREWVIAQKNKPTEVRSKQIIYRLYLEPRFKDTPLDKIDVSAIAQLRADLVEAELSWARAAAMWQRHRGPWKNIL